MINYLEKRNDVLEGGKGKDVLEADQEMMF